jgi:hypothetical protein
MPGEHRTSDHMGPAVSGDDPATRSSRLTRSPSGLLVRSQNVKRRVEHRCLIGELVLVVENPAKGGVVSCVGVVGDKQRGVLLTEGAKVPGSVEWVEPRRRQFGCVTDVVEVCRRDQSFMVVTREGQAGRGRGDRLHVRPEAPEAGQVLLGERPGPLDPLCHREDVTDPPGRRRGS